MKKEIVMGLFLVAMLVACSIEPQVSGRKITGALVTPELEVQDEPYVQPQVPEKTAAEALQEAKSTMDQPVAKAGVTLYPPIVSDKTGKDALLERTRAAFSKSTAFGVVDADSGFGPKYHELDGDPANLPGEYGTERVEN